MLHFSSASRNAPEHNPEREERLLGFAAGNPPNSENEQPLEGTEPEQPEERRMQRTPEGTQEPIEGIERETHGKAEATVEGNVTIASIAEKAEKLFEDAHKALKKMEEGETAAFVKERFNDEEKKNWDENVQFMRDNMAKLNDWRELAHNLVQWESGKLPPGEIILLLEALHTRFGKEAVPQQAVDTLKTLSPETQEKLCRAYGLSSIDEVAQHVGTDERGLKTMDLMRAHINSTLKGRGVNDWQELNESSRVELTPQLVNELKGIGNLEEILKYMDHELSTWRGGMDEQEKYLQRIEDGIHEKGGEEDFEDRGGHEGFWGNLGIQWYSLYDIMEAVKQWKEAYIKSWEKKKELKGSILAQQLGTITKWLPFAGDELEITLEEETEHRYEERKNHFKEYLKSGNFTFRNLFTKGGLMETHHDDPNHARGILEYAASRGWLYDLEQTQFMEERQVFGYSLKDLCPPTWDKAHVDNYYMTLISENASGMESETKSAETKYYDLKLPRFMDALDDELDKLNFWAALGVVKDAMKRGLWGEISPWLVTRILRKMREDPLTRKYMPTKVLDRFGIESFYRTTFTLGMLKGELSTIHKWMKQVKGVQDEDTFQQPLPEEWKLGTVIKRIEEEVKAKAGRKLSTYDLDHTVAKILAGQTVEVSKGQKITIFSDRYSAYRTTPKMQGAVTVGQEDEDYYNMESELILADAGIFRSVFKYSNGHLMEESRAQRFADKIFLRYDDLTQTNPGAAENFCTEVGRKVQTFIDEALDDSRSTPLRTIMTKTPKGVEKENLLTGLLKRKMITLDKARDIVRNKRQNVGGELARWLLEQTGELPPAQAGQRAAA